MFLSNFSYTNQTWLTPMHYIRIAIQLNMKWSLCVIVKYHILNLINDNKMYSNNNTLYRRSKNKLISGIKSSCYHINILHNTTHSKLSSSLNIRLKYYITEYLDYINSINLYKCIGFAI